MKLYTLVSFAHLCGFTAEQTRNCKQSYANAVIPSGIANSTQVFHENIMYT